MAASPPGLYIGGEWRSAGMSEPVTSPYDGSVVGRAPVGFEADMEDAVAAAAAARRPMAALSGAARGAALEQIRAGLIAEQDDLALTLCRESGKPIRDARVEVQRAIHVFQIAAEEARRFGSGDVLPLDRLESSAHRTGLTRRFPAGPVGAITPFNFPLNLVVHKVAPALAAGNPVVLKPAHQTPLTAFALAQIISLADLPPGAFNIVHCAPALGERLATDTRVAVLSFTGSARVGWKLKALANTKRVTLELGGNAAVIVHEDADIDQAAARCATGGFAYAGQVCISVQRIFVHQPVYERFVDALVSRASALVNGDPAEERTDIGPMISAEAAGRVAGWVGEAVRGGARLRLGDGVANGTMLRPCVLTETDAAMAVNQEEVFGPVVTVTPYADFEQALALANNSAYGLQAGVFTRDIGRIYAAYETLEVGGVIVNDVPGYRIDHMPYGGVKGSGFGREGVRYAMEEMSELRLLVLNLS